ncbi:hypothetical protein HO133_010505 [Letharia lupina]|uniref:Uncharacterized protein n=1 Tax=Letharia lupina TaxID=560253 RepID=A0A8H6CIN8_9LECA|nr:uncharacterized protein HO133_010505 [Letharia lupina]KAF6223931.1 hypothetical protein HO133_010505 [Letharia lupina]
MSRQQRHSSILTPQGLEGCILFLKKIKDVHNYYLEKYDLDSSVFWHPVLVLQTDEATNEATICISLRQLTTLNHRNAEDCFPSSDIKLYLAVWPKHPPYFGQPQLNLQGDATLRRPGYISIRREYLLHQSMLQPYDWDQLPNYYRLTQRSFAVVVAKLDTISYHTRVNKLNAEDCSRRLATSRAKESETPTSFGQIKLLVSVFLLAAAMIWAKSKSDPACGEWLVRRSFEILMQVWIVALGVSWGVGKLITIGLEMLGNAVGVWGEGLLRSI